MIKVLIVDDEVKARNVLDHYLINVIQQEFDIRLADSVSQALDILESFMPDIVFLDIEMPAQNGFELLIARKNPACDIIFTTAYNHAIQAIRFSALDYLLKPVDPQELQKAVNRHLEKNEYKSTQDKEQLYDNLVKNIGKSQVKDFRLTVPSNKGVYFFNLDEILWLEADKNYTCIHLLGKKPFLSSKTLKHFEDTLGEFNFIRTHKSHLLNPKYIKQVTH